MLIAIIAIVVVAIAIYAYLAFTCFFTQVTFLAAYKHEFEKSGSRQAAVKAAINVFIGRAPFNILNQSDVDRLSVVFGLVPDPVVVAQIFRAVDRKRDAQQLRDENFLNRLEMEYRMLSEHRNA